MKNEHFKKLLSKAKNIGDSVEGHFLSVAQIKELNSVLVSTNISLTALVNRSNEENMRIK